MKFYGQHGLDRAIWEFFDGKRNGFFIDVGAHDGISLSNSYVFEREANWNGMCFEPHPNHYKALYKNRDCACFEMACVHDDSINRISFYADMRGKGYLSGVNPDPGYVNKLLARVRRGFKSFKKITVDATTVERVMGLFSFDQQIDFMSVDVEGTEIDVLYGTNLNKNRPRLLVVEANSKEQKEELDTFLETKGYLYAGSIAINGFYVTNEEDLNRIRNLKSVKIKEHLEL